MAYKYLHGLAVMRAQPFSVGHQRMVDRMLRECGKVTVLLGSIQEQGTDKNPFNYTTRKKMIQNVYRHAPDYERLKIMGIVDIANQAEWSAYVLDFVSETNQDWGVPDAYYAGTDYDAHWFKAAVENIVINDRTDKSHPFVSSSMIRDMLKFGDDRWKEFIAGNNQDLVEEHFAKKKGIS
ncbi:MAG: hypothetical protein FWF01_02300 [Alphaproteobacteria bacterium]|nr:hypothetical protein [Alphaproteobacteria bacterium]